jgi:RNA polymerase sigma factor (sigma-70 family)
MDFDRELIARAKAGDRSACETIVDQFAPMVFRLISRFFRTREDVEDLAQDVFLKLFARIDQVRPDENFPGWLARVTVNTCYDELRKTRRRKVAMETYGPETAGAAVVAPYEPDSLGKAKLAVQQLDPKLRIPLLLKEVEEMSVEEIARTMGLTQTNVKVRLFRARKKLASMLEEPGRGGTARKERGRREAQARQREASIEAVYQSNPDGGPDADQRRQREPKRRENEST